MKANTGVPDPTRRMKSAWAHFLAGLAGVQLLNLACAAVITGLELTAGGFAINLLFSILIGTLAYSFINGGRVLLWGHRNRPPLLPFLALMLAGLALAQVLGSTLGSRLTGMPTKAHELFTGTGSPPILMLTLLAGLTASWLFWNRSRMAELAARAEAEKARAAAVERQAIEAQLRLLQAQVEPHMLFNTLANLQGLIALDPPRAQQLLEQLITYLRATLSASRANQTTLGQEFALMRAYLGLMAVRMGPRLHYTLDLPPELEQLVLPPNLLQPLVENAIRHGLEPAVPGGHVEVRAMQQAGRLILEVQDDGIGMQQDADSAGTGLGLTNIRERLAALAGPEGRLELQANSGRGTLARLCLPLP